MILEDVDSDNEGHPRRRQSRPGAPSTILTPPSPTVNRQQETQSGSLHSQTCSDARPQLEQSQSVTKSQEDAETQTGRWTPFIENIKKEAEGVAMANMEER